MLLEAAGWHVCDASADNSHAAIRERLQLTDSHAQYFAYELTHRCPPDSVEKLADAAASAQVDLNPHQVDAARFASLSKGALLADKVSLSRAIEAGL